MKRIINIAKKDLLITLGDKSALILTILTPFALTLVMIFAFGGNQETVLTAISVAILNQDESEFGKKLVEVFMSEELSDLVSPTIITKLSHGKEGVDKDNYAALVIIPKDFGDILASSRDSTAITNGSNYHNQPAIIEIYGNPTMPTSVSVIQAIVDEFINRTSTIVIGQQVSIQQLIQEGLLSPIDSLPIPAEKTQMTTESTINDRTMISFTEKFIAGEADDEFDWAAYMAPSMALLFLMFTMTNGGRSLLTERESGTLHRILTSPASSVEIIVGKIFGIYLNGITQLFILMIASLIFFQIHWGPLHFVIPTVLFVVSAATGWGILIAAYSRTPGGANAVGTTITLLFAIGAGSFFPRQLLPKWLQSLSLISPNAWGLEAFQKIRLGTSFLELVPIWGGMLGMFLILFGISIFAFRRQFQ